VLTLQINKQQRSGTHDETVLGDVDAVLLSYFQEIINQPLCLPLDSALIQNIRAIVGGVLEFIMKMEKAACVESKITRDPIGAGFVTRTASPAVIIP
jgi:hypothetical protein